MPAGLLGVVVLFLVFGSWGPLSCNNVQLAPGDDDATGGGDDDGTNGPGDDDDAPCSDEGNGDSCGSATNLGAVAAGQVVMSATSVLRYDGEADWFEIGFPETVRPGGGKPTVGFVLNFNDFFRLDVFTDCMTPATCLDEAVPAQGMTEWTFEDPDDCCGGTVIHDESWPSAVFVKVTRVSGGSSCVSYQLEVSR